MFGLTGAKLVGAIAGPLLILAVIGGLAWSRGEWKEEALDFRKSTGEVTAQIGKAIGNPKLKWKDVPEQVDQIIISRDSWKTVAGEQTAAIDAMGAETARLQALNAELRARAQKEIARREAAINRLAASANDPGDRENCQQQIAAAEAALDAIFEEGL